MIHNRTNRRNVLKLHKLSNKQPQRKTLGLQWRTGRDSNPRIPQRISGFQNRRIQPLCHLSSGADPSIEAGLPSGATG